MDEETDQITTPLPLDIKRKTNSGQDLKTLAEKPSTSLAGAKAYPQTGDSSSVTSIVVGLFMTLFSTLALLFKPKKA